MLPYRLVPVGTTSRGGATTALRFLATRPAHRSSANNNTINKRPPVLSVDQLQEKTRQWMRLETEMYDANSMRQAKFLIRTWDQHPGAAASDARAKIMAFLMKKTLRGINPTKNIKLSSRDLVEMLHRVLLRSSQQKPTDLEQIQDAMWLLIQVEDILAAQQGYQNKRVNVVYSMIVRMFSSLRSPQGQEQEKDHPLRLLQAIVERRLSRTASSALGPDVQFFNIVMHALARLSRWDANAPAAAETLMRRMQHLGVPPDVVTYASLLNTWAKCPQAEGSMERAESILQEMEAPNTVCYNIVLNGLAIRGLADRAEALLWQMHRQWKEQNDDTIAPDVISLNSALHAHAKNRNVQAAHGLLTLMSADISPNFESYTTVMNAYGANSGEQVEGILNEMEGRATQRGETHVSPTQVTYLCAIHAWAQTQSAEAPDRAQAIVDRMIALGQESIRPDLKVYSALMNAWANSDRPEALSQVLQLLQDLESGKLVQDAPDVVTYNTVLSAMAKKGKPDEALHLLQRMKALDHVVPNVVSYTNVIQAFAKSDKEDAAVHARNLLEEAKSTRISPNTALYSSVILATSKGHPDNANTVEDVFWSMMKDYQDGNAACRPNIAVCNNVLRALAQAGAADAPSRAETFVKWMEDNDVPPDCLSFEYLVQIWGSSGKEESLQEIDSLLDQAVEKATTDPYKFRMTTSFFNAILGQYRRFETVLSAEEVEQFSSLMSSLAKNGHKCHPNRETFWLLKQLQSQQQLLS